jgi:hypothetical protein
VSQQDLRAVVERAESALIGGNFPHTLMAAFKTNFAKCWKCQQTYGWYTAALHHGWCRGYLEYARLVCEQAGVPLQLDEATEKRFRDEARRSDILDTAISFMQRRLWTEHGAPVLDYLRRRGYSDDEIRSMGLASTSRRP